MEELAKQLGITTVYATATYAFFHWLDENASDEAKAALARTMRWKKEQVASVLVETFDRIYTYPLLRWRAFFRSLLLTTVVSVFYLYEIGKVAPWKWAAGSNAWLLDTTLRWEIWTTGLLLNVFSDYLSLFVIRPLLARSGTKPVIGLALGTVSGAVIVVAATNLLRFSIIWLQFCHDEFFQAACATEPQALDQIVSQAFHDPTFVWPALAVFVWLPLFALGILIVRLLTPSSWIVGRMQWFLKEGKEHPLKAIGYVAAVVVFLGTVAARAIFSA
ncbi:hypothetical protein [Bradyrhizobium sp. AZCC 2230]|uniref:hypothetical protein n=1 Tax=Bradyrhizobium sp. AZCC 2230 TaxID=3117021 RepID=UPI002FEEAD3D